MKQRYVVNSNTGTLHIFEGCCHSKGRQTGAKIYETVDAAIAENQRYMKHCKLCFRKRGI